MYPDLSPPESGTGGVRDGLEGRTATEVYDELHGLNSQNSNALASPWTWNHRKCGGCQVRMDVIGSNRPTKTYICTTECTNNCLCRKVGEAVMRVLDPADMPLNHQDPDSITLPWQWTVKMCLGCGQQPDQSFEAKPGDIQIVCTSWCDNNCPCRSGSGPTPLEEFHGARLLDLAEQAKTVADLHEAPVITNAIGGKQHAVSFRYDLIPPDVLCFVAQVLSEGASRYGEYNWCNISIEDHLNHAIGHIEAERELRMFNAGSTTGDDDLVNAICRLLFARALLGANRAEYLKRGEEERAKHV